jgi:putative transposase
MTSDAVNPRKSDKSDGRQLSPEQAAAAAMVAEARQRGLELTGPDGLLKLFTKNVLETALNEEIAEHLGYEKNRAEAGRQCANVRNGARGKTVISDAAGEIRIDVPRDRDGTSGPQIVKKRQRRLADVDEIVLSLYAKGLTAGEISAHFAEIYGASISRETVSRITGKVVAEMQEWASRPLDAVYVAVFIDAVVVKVRDGQVASRPVYAAIGVTADGCKDVLGLWAGTGGEGARFWMGVLTDCKNRGVRDVFFLVRRAERAARGGREHMAAGHRPDMHYSSHQEYVPAHLPQGRGRDQAGHQAYLYRAQCGCGVRGAGRPGGEMG